MWFSPKIQLVRVIKSWLVFSEKNEKMKRFIRHTPRILNREGSENVTLKNNLELTPVMENIMS